ncbi:MAG: hypothetical protein DRJ32_05675 [Thermoprotei archaeon]|nr:MAG: hypothetical protein B6U94_05650 [Thermofilum sp. ex4484_79]RLE58861.1 MAG: hypothetical protein DRJ32_05675 [Thermoprotei archaeon]
MAPPIIGKSTFSRIISYEAILWYLLPKLKKICLNLPAGRKDRIFSLINNLSTRKPPRVSVNPHDPEIRFLHESLNLILDDIEYVAGNLSPSKWGYLRNLFEGIVQSESYRMLIRDIISKFKGIKDGVILELNPSSGRGLIDACKILGRRGLGVDQDPLFTEIGKEYAYRENIDNVEFICTDLSKISDHLSAPVALLLVTSPINWFIDQRYLLSKIVSIAEVNCSIVGLLPFRERDEEVNIFEPYINLVSENRLMTVLSSENQLSYEGFSKITFQKIGSLYLFTAVKR